jgi:hypothetical protein
VAVNPTNPRNIVGVWQQGPAQQGATQRIIAGASFDGGISWKPVLIPGVSLGSGGSRSRADAWVSFAPNGDVYVSSVLYQNIPNDILTAVLVSKSTDGGLTWGPASTLIQGDNNTVGIDDKPSITADPTDARFVYSVWTRFTPTTSYVMFDRSSDGGKTWETARPILDAGFYSSPYGNIIRVLPNGTLADFVDNAPFGVPDGAPEPLWVLFSPDHGQNWPLAVPVNQVATMHPAFVVDPDTGAPVRAGEPTPGTPVNFFDVAVDRQNGNLYSVWPDAVFSHGRYNSIAFSMSSDGGSTWSQPIQINQTPDTTPAGDRQAFTPSIAVAADGTVAVTYYDFRFNNPEPGLPTDYWMVTANPHGPGGLTNPASWQHEIRLTDRSLNMENADRIPANQFYPGYFLGDYQGLTSSGNDFLAIFGQALSTRNSSEIFFRRIDIRNAGEGDSSGGLDRQADRRAVATGLTLDASAIGRAGSGSLSVSIATGPGKGPPPWQTDECLGVVIGNETPVSFASRVAPSLASPGRILPLDQLFANLDDRQLADALGDDGV